MTGVSTSDNSDDAPSEVTRDSVATGTADKTPAVAIGATALIVAVVFVIALGLAALAYFLAG
jgi:energy-converting hydrogenase Eha subunit A